MKKLKNHTIYEIFNPYTCESVFVDHKPSKEEIEKIRKLEKWPLCYTDNVTEPIEVEKIFIYTK